MKLSKFWLSYTNGTAFDDTGDNTSDGIALCFYLGDQLFHLLGFLLIRTAYGIGLCQRQIISFVVAIQGNRTNLRGISLYADSHLSQGQLCQSTSYASADRDSSRRTAASTMIPDAVFIIIGIVGMRWTEQATHIFIIL